MGTSLGLAQPLGLSNRVANTTLRLPPAPPVFGYSITNAFGNLTFTNPVALATPPDETNRLFVVEQRGRVAIITNLAAPTRSTFLDLVSRVVGGEPTDERGLLGLAFHPGYASNRYFYVFYSLNTTTPAGSGLHQRLSRFEGSASHPNQALPDSEVPLLTMRDDAGNHNGGDLHFGPDGYLYIALGDEGGANDTLNNSQVIGRDFWAGILRLDVDNSPSSLAPNAHPAVHAGTYRVPPDNPFIGATNFNGQPVNPAAVRTEFWAVGLRNPWRMAFDRETGLLYCGDVGQGAWEEINLIVRGGNYGWAFREGTRNGPKTAPPGFTSIAPLQEYAHGSGTNQGFSVTGGVVYRGSRLPQLYGHYVFGDYVSGNVWALRYAVTHGATNFTPFFRLASDQGVAGFGVDPSNGDVLLADQSEDRIKRLVFATVSGGPLPPTLADTGAFTNLATLTPHAGIVPYDLNTPFWSDHALKTRWFSVPNPANRITFRATNVWTFPTGTVWIKHFDLELTHGAPASRRRLETRFLVRDNTPTGVYGLTYRWDDAQTNATLVPSEGLDEPFTITDSGTTRTQAWRYPSRNECLICHTVAGGRALGFNTPQLNRDFDYGGTVDNQLRALSQAGYFTTPITNLHALPLLAHATNEAFSAEYRARSYLMANCSGCHQPGSVGLGGFDTRIYRPLSALGLINGPLLNPGGNPSNRVVVPGAPERSMLLTRISTLGAGRMPPLASSVLDSQAIALVNRWITELAGYLSFGDWQIAYFGSTNFPAAAADADPDLDLAPNFQEYLVGTNPTDGLSAWAVGIERVGAQAEIVLPRVANRGFEAQWTTNLSSSATWQFLHVPANRPFFSVSNQVSRVPVVLSNGPAEFYRVRVYEP